VESLITVSLSLGAFPHLSGGGGGGGGGAHLSDTYPGLHRFRRRAAAAMSCETRTLTHKVYSQIIQIIQLAQVFVFMMTVVGN
jgi:hypothetical protein